MCGIFGFYGFENKKLLEKMCKSITHRGPDSIGYFVDNKISLGNTRLAVIDLKTGKQPIFNEDHSVCTVFNGEIYNFKVLRRKLEERGHKFSTNSDTEVIIHTYEEFGENCLDHFDGMFAFALWDSKKRILLLARDRIGIKPLYYTIIDNCLLFASEIKSLLLFEELKREINYNALNLYLSFRYVPGDKTLFKGIYKLPQGHYLTFNKNGVKIKKFWALKYETSIHNEQFYSKNILQLLSSSVEERLMSDVPLGVFISGGLDSGGILSLMSKTTDLKTFSIGFEGKDKANELTKARNLAEIYSTDHYETLVGTDSFKLLSKIIWHLDNLIGDPVIIANYVLSQLAKKYVKVILCGEGADELFAGYVHHRNSLYGYYFNKYTPQTLQKLAINITKVVPAYLLNIFFNYPAKLSKEGKDRVINILSTLNKYEKNYLYQISLFTDENKNELFFDTFATENQYNSEMFINNSFKNISSAYFIDKISLHEFHTWLPDYILSKLDYLTMAHSVEGRVPYLDHRLVEFTMKIPVKYKMRGLQEKYILRRALKHALPKRVVNQKKQAFIMPINSHFKKEMNELSKNIFFDQTAKRRKLYSTKYINKLLNSTGFIHSKQLFALLSLEIWFRTYIDQENPQMIRKVF